MADPHRRRGRRVQCRRLGADHRLPVRARPRHSNRAARRDRPGRAVGAADQRPGGARVDEEGRHDRARQDGHRDDRGDDARRRTSSRRTLPPRRCCASLARSRRRASTRSRGPSPTPRVPSWASFRESSISQHAPGQGRMAPSTGSNTRSADRPAPSIATPAARSSSFGATTTCSAIRHRRSRQAEQRRRSRPSAPARSRTGVAHR